MVDEASLTVDGQLLEIPLFWEFGVAINRAGAFFASQNTGSRRVATSETTLKSQFQIGGL